MGILSRLFENEVRSGYVAALRAVSSGVSAAGVTVTPESSLQSTAVLGAVLILSQSVAGLPCIVYERRDGNRRRATEHPLYPILHDSPNDTMTAFELYEVGMSHLCLWGNFYAEIERSNNGQVLALWPLVPARVSPFLTGEGKFYQVEVPGGGPVTLADYQVLHVPGFGYDGVAGKSPIQMARDAIGLSRATEQFGSTFFGNGARPGVVLQHPGELSDKAYQRLLESWEARHKGLSNAQRVAILEESMTVATIGVPPDDAQFLQTRKFQVAEIARVFRVPPHLLADLERATFSNIEHQSIEFLSHTVRPWLVRWEQRIRRSLLTARDRERYTVEFLVDGLLRGDQVSRYQAYATGRQWGWLSANDIRRLENMNAIAGGDGYLVPLNMSETNVGTRAQPGQLQAGPTYLSSVGPDPSSPAPGQGPTIERRATVAASRRRLAASFQRSIEDVARRIVNREANDIRNAARREIGRGGLEAFERWLIGFLEEHSRFISQYLGPALMTYAELVAAEVERELETTIDPTELEAFVADYRESRSGIWAGRLGAETRAAAGQAAEQGQDPVEAVDLAMARRQEVEPGKFAMDQATRAANAVAVALYGLAGVRKLFWSSVGESCPYCSNLNGVVIEISGWFLTEGDSLAPDGAEPFTGRSNVRHPPLHGGCDCMVTSA